MPLVVFSIAALLMLLIGFLAGRKQTEEGYLIYDRKLGGLSYLISYTATYIGAGFFIAGSAYAYLYGLGFAWFFIAMMLGTFIFGYFASWLKEELKEKHFYTMAEYYRWRFGERASKVLAALISVVIVVEIAVQLISGAKLLEALNFAPYLASILVTIVVVGIYLFSSGFRAVVWTDYVMLVVIMVMVALIGIVFGQQLDYSQISFDISAMPTGTIVGLMLVGLFLPFATPHYWQRIFAARTSKGARRGTWLSGIALLFPAAAMLLIGEGARQVLGEIDPDLAFINAIKHMGPFVAIGGGILLWAALMSTTDTHAFSGSQILVRDLLGKKLSKMNVRLGILALLIPSLILSIIVPSIMAIALLFVSAVMIIAPSAVLHWFWKLEAYAVTTSLVLGSITLFLWAVFRGITPAAIVITLTVSLISLLLVEALRFLRPRRS